MAEKTRVSLTVGRLADAFGITVRTLRHYDDVGLLVPSDRSPAGYRQYCDADVTRLQHIVVYRRLGFGLEEIRLLLDNPESVEEHLVRQRAAVMSRLDEMRALVEAIDRAIERERSGMKLTKEEQKELFGEAFCDEYAAEAEQRWGDTDAWRQSRSRTAGYTRAGWIAVRAEADAVTAAFVAAKRAGLPADGVAAMDAAEQHCQHIHERFYDVSTAMHRCLGDMYVTDPRFTKTYEALEPGLAQYVRDAIHANADRRDTQA